MKITGAQILADMLAGYGVSHVFMVPAVLRRTFAEMERRTSIARIHCHGEKAAAYIEACRDFHKQGIPVIGDHVGGLPGLAALAFGAVGGIAHGVTDDFCYNVVKDPVHVRDFNATVLRLLGINHERLTFKFQGLEQKLTGVVPAKVVPELMS